MEIPIYVQIILIVLAALLTGFNGLIVWILSDVRSWLKGLSAEFHAHATDRAAHCKK